MKKLSKLVLVLFSVIILIIGVVVNLLVIGWLDYSTAFGIIQKLLTTTPQNKIILGITELCMLFAVICIFADSGSKEETKAGRDVLMQNCKCSCKRISRSKRSTYKNSIRRTK